MRDPQAQYNEQRQRQCPQRYVDVRKSAGDGARAECVAVSHDHRGGPAEECAAGICAWRTTAVGVGQEDGTGSQQAQLAGNAAILQGNLERAYVLLEKHTQDLANFAQQVIDTE